MNRRLLTPLCLLTLLLWLGGCSEGPTESETRTDLNLEDEFGGYTVAGEEPGFGDALLLEEAAANEEYNDEILTVPAVDSFVADTQSGFYHLRAVWGRLCYDSTVTEVTDWTGSLTVSRGVEVIRQAIRFEPGQDYVLPRTDPKAVEWVSQTTTHNDGISVDIYVPRPRPIFDTSEVILVDSLGDTSYVTVVDTIFPEPEPVTVSFETGPYDRVFAVEELMALDTVVYLDDSNAVAFHGLNLHRYACPRGFVAGRWGFDEEGQGVFRGMWMSGRGRLAGYIRGHFGKNRAGMNVFFGKWVSRDGQFEGFLKGTYGGVQCLGDRAGVWRFARGRFAGKIYDADRQQIGVLTGRYHSAPSHQNGFFQGRWRLNCGQAGGEGTAGE